jgi:hypothetical protein
MQYKKNNNNIIFIFLKKINIYIYKNLIIFYLFRHQRELIQLIRQF